MFAALETWWAGFGSAGNPVVRQLQAHARMIRPSTRLWFDTLMPLAYMMVLTGGDIPVPDAWIFVVATNLLHIAATIINDLQDMETDRHSSERLRATRPIASGVIPFKVAVFEAAACAIGAIALTCLISWLLGGLFLLLWLLIMAHELPPLSVQSRGIWAQILAVLGLALCMFTIVAAVDFQGFVPSIPYLVFIVAYLGLAETLVKDLRDTDNDRAAGKQTTPVKYGPGTAAAMAAGGYIIAGLPWAWFVWQYPAERLAPLVMASLIYAAWIGFTLLAAKRLSKGFSKELAVSLHHGSVLNFSLLCLGTIVALL